MKKEFVSYKLAGYLEELGFDEPCLATIDQTEYIHIKGTREPIRGAMMYYPVDCPLYQQAFRWFRDKYGVLHDIDFGIGWGYGFIPVGTELKLPTTFTEGFDTYEEAELACLTKLVEIVK